MSTLTATATSLRPTPAELLANQVTNWITNDLESEGALCKNRTRGLLGNDRSRLTQVVELNGLTVEITVKVVQP